MPDLTIVEQGTCVYNAHLILEMRSFVIFMIKLALIQYLKKTCTHIHTRTN